MKVGLCSSECFGGQDTVKEYYRLECRMSPRTWIGTLIMGSLSVSAPLLLYLF